MAKSYTVKQGDCLASIACEHGFLVESLWNHPENQALREKRKDPNILLPGDVVFIPDRPRKSYVCESGKRHVFRVKNRRVVLRLRLVGPEGPRVSEAYTLEVEGKTVKGRTDEDGKLECPIDPRARQARLILDGSGDEYRLALGALDPAGTPTGVQARLNKLGFVCGKVDGVVGPKTRAALKSFQRKHGLEPSGEADTETIRKLMEEHGGR